MYFYQGSKSQSDKVNDVWETYFSDFKKEKCFMNWLLHLDTVLDS